VMTMKVKNKSKEHESKEHACEAVTFWAEITPFLSRFSELFLILARSNNKIFG